MKAQNKSQLCNQSSGNVELYTPPEIIAAARGVLGEIDLDPASSEVANKRVRAKRYFAENDDGLAQPWAGNVWMNHPWGAREKACKPKCKKKICKRRGYHLAKDFPGNAAWINKLVDEFESGDVTQALCITYASTGEGWFKPLKKYAVCFLDGRTSFYTPDGEPLNQNTKGCAVTYFGRNLQAFYDLFTPFGAVMVPAALMGEIR
ncbi:hypothetical protein GCM10011369_23120 [Neiella marina]|uniref:Uncharacterized protein n=1 Tax=Neiella marina TaxID=508461 RepID=A0A8J2U5R1_9GAMM|nr:DNA N-6-adenine-methyltransferase [Neiella marina]GGA80565.1 hypothetical protein GCM10011369_23120 [Neiella marina]